MSEARALMTVEALPKRLRITNRLTMREIERLAEQRKHDKILSGVRWKGDTGAMTDAVIRHECTNYDELVREWGMLFCFAKGINKHNFNLAKLALREAATALGKAEGIKEKGDDD